MLLFLVTAWLSASNLNENIFQVQGSRLTLMFVLVRCLEIDFNYVLPR